MLVKKKDVRKILITFLFSHLFIWTLIPSLSNNNLPLDTIEALAWGSNLNWGYSKHPPLSAFFVEGFYQIFGNRDWVYYLLSQIFVIAAFFIVFKFSQDFFKKKIYSFFSILLLEGIYFYNFTTPEFNVNVCQLPFWALTVYYCWKGVKQNDYSSWLLFGLFAGLGVLSKYLFFYLLIAVDIFFIYLIVKKKFQFRCFVSLISFALVLLPHLIWLTNNDFITITYAMHRTGLNTFTFIEGHLFQPIIFLFKQFGILIPFFIMLFSIILKLKSKINFKDKKFIFLLTINLAPIILMFFTSMILGIKIRTMWMTPFYLFLGVLFIYVMQNQISLKRIKYFSSIFLILFILSPASYLFVSITEKDKRTDYPGKKIAYFVQENWKNKFVNQIGIVGGDEWHAGNLIYNLNPRPEWDNIFENDKNFMLKNTDDGFILIGDKNILSTICTNLTKGNNLSAALTAAVFIEVEKQGICMIGKKK